MISRDEIDKTILELEQKDTSYAVIERLAWLYCVRDHMLSKKEITGDIQGDEFCMACSGVPVQALLNIIGEHMQCVRALYPKEYQTIISKIKDLK